MNRYTYCLSSITEEVLQQSIKENLEHDEILFNHRMFLWESDVLLKVSDVWVELECKRTLADFKADFKKKRKHLALSGRYDTGNKPNHFGYIVPWYIIEDVKNEIPSYAGLLCYNKDNSIDVIKELPLLHSNKINPKKKTKKCASNWGRPRKLLIEGEAEKRITVDIPESLLKVLKKLSKKDGRSIKELLISPAVEKYMV